jgi:hypothetical protein
LSETLVVEILHPARGMNRMVRARGGTQNNRQDLPAHRSGGTKG